ncbi:transmembrane protein 150A isoform X1 [Ictidomys tridecemlineatus]|uniref:transmembrane protein 150A isoform X3 n=1 Tax=Ictidomys tridecemlineatus TaxID=43179 RepID=UPI000B547303|nr:transmembrane protein 150A isoform X3 [Ictidomys tridecemlineatus]KAG3267926.1 hypothetical protein H1C71_035488 [Ictidomys tridecemlineatus]
MTAWILLPVSLSAFSITGIWTVYAMAVMNRHVCPVENWSYNESCSPDPAEQGGPKTCCTLDDVPLISKCGTYPPESCLFSLIGNVGAFMVALICLLRYGQLLEQSRHSWVNTTALITGCTNAVGLVVVGNFQVDHAKPLHYVGAGVAFPAGLLFVCLHCALSYHGAATPLDLVVAYLRSVLAAIAFVTLVLTVFQVASSLSTRAPSYSTGQPCVSGCSSSISSFSMAPSAMSLGQCLQTLWWPLCSLPLAGPASPRAAAAPPHTSTVPPRASP